jgi:itaconate CoA-transferase
MAKPATTPSMKAYDLLVQAESGLAMITGHPAGPGRVGVSACDIACGMAAHAGVLEALIAAASPAGRRAEGQPVRRHGRLDERSAAVL